MEQAASTNTRPLGNGLGDATTIATWVIRYVARLTGTDIHKIKTSVPFTHYGVDSAAAADMAAALEDWLELKIDPVIAYDHPTPEALGNELARLLARKHAQGSK